MVRNNDKLVKLVQNTKVILEESRLYLDSIKGSLRDADKVDQASSLISNCIFCFYNSFVAVTFSELGESIHFSESVFLVGISE